MLTTSNPNLVRQSLGGRIKEALKARGISFELTRSQCNGLRYVINGETLTPGEVAARFRL